MSYGGAEIDVSRGDRRRHRYHPSEYSSSTYEATPSRRDYEVRRSRGGPDDYAVVERRRVVREVAPYDPAVEYRRETDVLAGGRRQRTRSVDIGYGPEGYRREEMIVAANPRSSDTALMRGGRPEEGRGDERDRGEDRERGRKHHHGEKEKGHSDENRKRAESIGAGLVAAGAALGAKEAWDRRQHRPGGVVDHIRQSPVESAAIGLGAAYAGYEGSKYWREHREKEGKDGHLINPHLLESGAVGATLGAITGRSRSRHRPDARRTRSYSESPPRRRKSFAEQALGFVGLDETRGGQSGKARRSQSRNRHALEAAATAAAVEAFRSRKNADGRTRRIVEAAVGAGGVDRLVDKGDDHHTKRHLAEAVITGLVGQRVLNGKESRSRSRHGSRSGGSSGLPLAALAGGAAAAYQKHRSKSRTRARSPDYSDDSYSGDDRRSGRYGRDREGKPRRHSLGGDLGRAVTAGLGALGLEKASDKHRDLKEKHMHRDYGTYADSDSDRDDRRSRGRPSGNTADEYYGGASRGVPEVDDKYVRRPRRDEDVERGRGGTRSEGGHSRSSSSDSNTTDEEKEHKRLRGKELSSAALAAVASIHAAHSISETKHKRDERHKAVVEGKMSPEEARRQKRKATLKDLASIGIAAYGAKGALGEWKKLREEHVECKTHAQKVAEKRAKRREKQAKRAAKENGSSNGDGRDGRYGRTSSNADGWYSDPQLATPAYSVSEAGTVPLYRDDNPYSARAMPPPPGAYAPGYRDERY